MWKIWRWGFRVIPFLPAPFSFPFQYSLAFGLYASSNSFRARNISDIQHFGSAVAVHD